MLDRMSDLPESVQEIAEVIGRDEALSFVQQLPCTPGRKWRKCVYIPQKVTPDHPLVRMLGWTNAQKMSRAFTGMILQPSNCRFIHRRHRDREIIRMKSEGVSPRDIADMVELSVYRVREIIKFGEART